MTPILKLFFLVDKFFEKKFLRVLLYHSITDQQGINNSIGSDSFREQMCWLYSRGYQCASMNEIDSFINNKADCSNKIAISFDDGYKNNLYTASPIMSEYGYAGIVFIATKYINTKGKLGADSDETLDIDEIKILEQKGWDVCNHFHSHQKLTEMTAEQINEEIKLSQQILNGILLKRNNSKYFALPKNRYNKRIREILRNHEGLFFIGEGVTSQKLDNFFIHRIEVYDNDDIFKFKLKTSISYNLLKQNYKRMFKIFTN